MPLSSTASGQVMHDLGGASEGEIATIEGLAK
jgi:hypothetical protein